MSSCLGLFDVESFNDINFNIKQMKFKIAFISIIILFFMNLTFSKSNDEELFLKDFIKSGEFVVDDLNEKLESDPNQETAYSKLFGLLMGLGQSGDGDCLKSKVDREVLVAIVKEDYEQAFSLIFETSLHVFIPVLIENIYKDKVNGLEYNSKIKAQKVIDYFVNDYHADNSTFFEFVGIKALSEMFPEDQSLKKYCQYNEGELIDWLKIYDDCPNPIPTDLDSVFLNLVYRSRDNLNPLIFDYAYNLDPENEKIAIKYAKKLVEKSKDKDSLNKVIEILKLPIESPEGLILRSNVFIMLKDNKNALETLDLLLEKKILIKYRINGLKIRVGLLKNMGMAKRALDDFMELEEILSDGPTSYIYGSLDPVGIAYLKAECYSQMEEHRKAIELFVKTKDFIKKEQQEGNSYHRGFDISNIQLALAYEYLSIKNWKQASFEALRDDYSCKMSEIIYDLKLAAGHATFMMGNTTEALKYYKYWLSSHHHNANHNSIKINVPQMIKSAVEKLNKLGASVKVTANIEKELNSYFSNLQKNKLK